MQCLAPFLAHIFMLFHMVGQWEPFCSECQLVKPKTIFGFLLKSHDFSKDPSVCPAIRNFNLKVLRVALQTIWITSCEQPLQICTRKCGQKLCAFLFWANSVFGKKRQCIFYRFSLIFILGLCHSDVQK